MKRRDFMKMAVGSLTALLIKPVVGEVVPETVSSLDFDGWIYDSEEGMTYGNP